MKEQKISIIGGGLSGLAAGYYLDKKKIRYNIFEKEDSLGGLCRSVKSNGFSFDFTGHLLHLSNSRIRKLVFDLLNKNIKELKRNAWIFTSNVYVPYSCIQSLNYR